MSLKGQYRILTQAFCEEYEQIPEPGPVESKLTPEEKSFSKLKQAKITIYIVLNVKQDQKGLLRIDKNYLQELWTKSVNVQQINTEDYKHRFFLRALP